MHGARSLCIPAGQLQFKTYEVVLCGSPIRVQFPPFLQVHISTVGVSDDAALLPSTAKKLSSKGIG